MLILNNLVELKTYLHTRLDAARNQPKPLNAGIVYGFEESIKAVDTLIAKLNQDIIEWKDGSEDKDTLWIDGRVSGIQQAIG